MDASALPHIDRERAPSITRPRYPMGTLPSLLLQPLPDEFLIDTLKSQVRSRAGENSAVGLEHGDYMPCSSLSYRTEEDARRSTTCRSFTQHCRVCLGQADKFWSRESSKSALTCHAVCVMDRINGAEKFLAACLQPLIRASPWA